MAADPGLVAAAQGLAPRIRAWRADIEHQRRLPPELVGAVRELKLFRLFIPTELGGLETDLLDSGARSSSRWRSPMAPQAGA